MEKYPIVRYRWNWWGLWLVWLAGLVFSTLVRRVSELGWPAVPIVLDTAMLAGMLGAVYALKEEAPDE